MDINKGKLIVIDGTDGSGKATQIELLSKYLKEQNIPIEVIDFPRYSDNIYGQLIRRYLDGEFGTLDQVSPYFASLAYAGDRALAKTQLEEWLNQGKIVLANRYVPSNKAHQGAKLPESQRNEFMHWLERLEYETNSIPREDLVIFLNVPTDIAQANVDKRGLRDIHEASSDHLSQTSALYLQLSQQNDNWVVINCLENEKMRSKEDINRDVIEALKQRGAI